MVYYKTKMLPKGAILVEFSPEAEFCSQMNQNSGGNHNLQITIIL